MSVLHSIAYGIVNLDEMAREQRKAVHHAARMEAHGLGYWISGCRSENCCDPLPNVSPNNAVARQHKLTRWNKDTFRDHRRYQQRRRPGITERQRPLLEGSFTECCRALIDRTTPPPNHETTDA